MTQLAAGAPLDILHLSFKPPFAPGSFNRLVGTQLSQLSGLRQAAFSYWDQPVPVEVKESVILVNEHGLSLRNKLACWLPEAALARLFHEVTDRKYLVYLWQLLKWLPHLRPKVIVCYDLYKFGAQLRQAITWPCRLVLSQHGLSYFLSALGRVKPYQLAAFDVVWTLTQAAYRFDRAHHIAYEPLVKVIPNWLDTTSFKPANEIEKQALRAHWTLPQDKLLVLWLSRLVPKKGAHALLQAWPKILQSVPNAFLWLVGGGEPSYENYLKRLSENLGVSDSVRLQGGVAPELIADCHRVADLFVFPTLFSGEGCGLALLEAMACGVACVASDHAVIRELYAAETLTLVPDPNLEDAFVSPVVSLLRDEAQRTRQGQAARAFVVEHYQQEKILARVAEFYQQQLGLVGK